LPKAGYFDDSELVRADFLESSLKLGLRGAHIGNFL